jgi:hypothetical protein
MKPPIALRLLFLCTLSVSFVSWDQAAKALAKEYFRHKPAHTFHHDNIGLQYADNTDAMSMATAF